MSTLSVCQTWTLFPEQPTLRIRMCEAPASPVAPSWPLESARNGHWMAKVKLTKVVVDAAAFRTRDYELRDTVVPGLLLKVTPAGRKIFMLQYRTNGGNRRKPVIGRFGELTVEQARSIARDWLADVRRGKDPSAEKMATRAAPSVKELCTKFIEDYSKPRIDRGRLSVTKATSTAISFRASGPAKFATSLGRTSRPSSHR